MSPLSAVALLPIAVALKSIAIAFLSIAIVLLSIAIICLLSVAIIYLLSLLFIAIALLSPLSPCFYRMFSPFVLSFLSDVYKILENVFALSTSPPSSSSSTFTVRLVAAFHRFVFSAVCVHVLVCLCIVMPFCLSGSLYLRFR